MKKLLFLAVLWLAAPRATVAQTPITEAELTEEQATFLVGFFNASNTTRLTGDARLPPQSQTGDVAMLAGELTLAGHVTGSVVVINGSIRFEAGSRVDGDVFVIGGPVGNPENATARSITLYRELVRYELNDGVLVHRKEEPRDELSAGRTFDFGRTEILIAARGGYNRVEGLPIQTGGRVTLGHSNPTTFEGALITRTAEFDNPGHALQFEQFLGGRRAARVGFRWADETLAIQQWGFSDRENSLSTFLLHRDYRDHYNRKGWTAYFRIAKAGQPLDFSIGYSEFDVRGAVVHDPFTLLYNDDEWRHEPQQREDRFTTLNTRLLYDTRNDEREPAAGWLAQVGVELEVKGAERYRYGIVDVRRYARLSPNAKLAMRAVLAGSIKGDSLPVFRQQSLGGEGSLPGYELHQFDCDSHEILAFGCDRLALVQLEYQSNFRALSRITGRLGRDFGLLDNIRWLVFVNSGRAWTDSGATGLRSRGTSDFVTDAGVGIRFGVLGVYWAVPLSDRGTSTNFFVRLGSRL
jgi:hypothetical protein